MRRLTNIELIIMSLLAASVGCSLLAPAFFGVKWALKPAFYTMWIQLGFGLLMLIFRKPRLMFAAFIGCGILSFYLKQRGDSRISLSLGGQAHAPAFKVLHLNLAASGEDPDGIVAALLGSDADVISLQEVTPVWQEPLAQALQDRYPFRVWSPRLDCYGMAVFSRLRLIQTDTLYYEDIPSLDVCLQEPTMPMPLHLISTHTLPPYSTPAFVRLQFQLDSVARYAAQVREPLIALGDFNIVTWSAEFQQFLTTAHLYDCRQDFMPSYPRTPFSRFNLPVDHLLYSRHFRCAHFSEVTGSGGGRIGIEGVFQFADDVEMDQ